MRTSLALVLCGLVTAASLPAQDFTGTYAIGGGAVPITLTLRQDRQGLITGMLQGQTAFQIQAQAQGQQFAGYAANAAGRLYLAGQLAEGGLQLVMAEVGPDGQPQMATARSLMAARTGGAAGPSGGAAPERSAAPMGGPGGPGGGGGGVAGNTPQDRQLAQLLMRSAWCSFSYVSGGGSSGRSSTERVVFGADGSGQRSTGGESYYSGSAGSVAGSGSGGGAFRWRTQGGQLVVSEDGMNWVPTPLQIATNSNGYPIITANGREYSMCQ